MEINDQNDQDILLETLKNFMFLQKEQLSEEAAIEMSKDFIYKEGKADDIIFETGFPVDGFYVILEGSISVWIYKPEGEQNEDEKKDSEAVENDDSQEKETESSNKSYVQQKHKYAWDLQSGKLFGELSVLVGGSRKATITCKTDCRFAFIDKEDAVKHLSSLTIYEKT